MRYSRLAFLLALIPSTASAQITVVDLPQRLAVTSQVSPDLVIARLMTFDLNQDGKISSDELSERMRPVVARADSSGDGALDVSEIRAVAAAPMARKMGAGGNYSFGDFGAVPMRMRIADAIEDLRLPAAVSEQASRIGETYAGEVEDAALAKLHEVVAPMLTEAQLAEFEASMKEPGASGSVVTMMSTPNGGAVQQAFLVAMLPAMQLKKYELSAEQRRAAMAAMTTFNTDRQFDDARRSDLMTRFEGVLSQAEREDLQAALARRPLVKNTPGKNAGAVFQSVVLRSVQ